MISHTTEKFRKLLKKLPTQIQKQAIKAFRQFQTDPYHPGLRYKRVHSRKPIYSIRISKDYRALGVIKDGVIVWFWIGSHSDHEEILKN